MVRNSKVNSSSNPFYGKTGLKNLLSQATRVSDSNSLIQAAWKDCSNLESRQLFHMINFSIGEIENRQHNVFGKKEVDGGGSSNSPHWINYVKWLIKNDVNQFVKFLPIIVEYVGWRELLTFQVKTKKMTKSIVGTWGLLQDIMSNTAAYKGFVDFIESTIRSGEVFNCHQIVKYMHIPRWTRKGTKTDKKAVREMQTQTITKMELSRKLVVDVSTRMYWEIKEHMYEEKKVIDYKGYREFRRLYSGDLQTVLFSTKNVLKLDKVQFQRWFSGLPSSSGYAVRRRLLDENGAIKDNQWKDFNMGKWILELDKFKADELQKQLVLAQELKKAKAEINRGVDTKSADEIVKMEKDLAKATKNAKVNTGAQGLMEQVKAILTGKANDNELQTLYSKIKWQVPVLVCADISGSMSSVRTEGLRNCDIASLMATIALMKNQELEEYNTPNLLALFHSYGELVTDNCNVPIRSNKYMATAANRVEKLIDMTKTISENYATISSIVTNLRGSTSFSGIPELLKKWVDSATDEGEKSVRIEQIQSYAVFLCISDGDLNNDSSAVTSFLDFKKKMLQWFQWDGVIYLWEPTDRNMTSRFDGIDNFIHQTKMNAAVLNQIFNGLTDLSVIDNYTELESLFKSERYQLVKSKIA